jgi:hypothetical protein
MDVKSIHMKMLKEKSILMFRRMLSTFMCGVLLCGIFSQASAFSQFNVLLSYIDVSTIDASNQDTQVKSFPFTAIEEQEEKEDSAKKLLNFSSLGTNEPLHFFGGFCVKLDPSLDGLAKTFPKKFLLFHSLKIDC